ncbi:MAG: hypothetical protein OXE86_01540 [Alphaproteobacteria bacterium]|nr:hypothetical protein [Alphaproteobacteria bacterium]
MLIADVLRTTKSGIAGTLGLGKDGFARASRVGEPKTRARLRQMLEVLDRVEAVTGLLLAAHAWFRAEPLTRHLLALAFRPLGLVPCGAGFSRVSRSR